MNSSIIEKRLIDLFDYKFDINKFRNFINDLFDVNKFEKPSISKSFSKEYINSVYSLGVFHDDDHNFMEIFVVNIKKPHSVERARVMQRNLIADLLKNRNRKAALVAFYHEEEDDWRLSYIDFEYEIIMTESGIDSKQKLTSPRRSSFLVGKNEINYTCKKQFEELFSTENISINDVKNVFSIENVTNEFFTKYKDLFRDLAESIENIVRKDKRVAQEFNDKNITINNFAKKLLSQIVFLYFIQKKGWLGVPKSGKWGEGPKDFMKRLFNKEYIDYSKNKFFDDVLEPLFYQGFSERVNDYHYSKFNFKVPFLNGGLFENMNGYDWRNTDLTISDAIFKDIFDTFDRFNFTIKEDEPLEKEVAVDPEMLGKVFENLLEIKDRKSTGAFYTPRYIVHYICQQTLISYLNTNATNISLDDLNGFIEKGDFVIDSIIKVQNEREQYRGNVYSKIDLPNSIIENKDLLIELLDDVKVIDPAVGSGAFPVGMMNEIVKAKHILYLLKDIEIDMYDLKKETIENSLYGIDISDSAVDITKLRFWLSLIVDEETTEEIKPLPNLDNQIMCGNTLINEFKGIPLFDKDLLNKNNPQTNLFTPKSEKLFAKLSKLKKRFFNENFYNNKIRIKNEINEIKWNFIEENLKENGFENEIKEIKKYKETSSKPFFIWELEFSEIFNNNNPGFDIVIGNPPYIKERQDRSAFDGLRSSPYYQGKMDLWTFFGCIALDYVKDGGCIGFIAPNAWITSSGASKFRNKVNDEAKILKFINFGNYKVFESADIQTMIYIMIKDGNDIEYEVDYSLLTKDDLNDDEVLTFLTSNQSFDYYKKYKSIFNRKTNNNSYFLFLDKDLQNIIDKIKNQNNIIYLTKDEVSTGIDVHQDFLKSSSAKKFGLDKFIGDGIFILTDDELESMTLNDNEKSLIKPYYTTDNLFRYHGDKKNNMWIIYTKSDINDKINKYPNIKKHFDIFKEVITSDNKPYGLHRSRNEELFLNEKIVVTRKCKIPTFTYVDFDSYVSQTFNIIKTERVDLKYLTGILNSKLIQFWLKYQGKMQGNHYQLDQEPLINIPIKYDKNNMEFNKKIISIVDEIIKCNRDIEMKIDSSNKLNELENRLNELVYELYNLNDTDIETIENNI